MLNSFDKVFDYADFEKKLKHYFTDTAPVYVNVEMQLDSVRVSSNKKLDVRVSIDVKLSVKENIRYIIECCERSLYPAMLDIVEQPVTISKGRAKELLFQGFTLSQIHEKKKKRAWKKFIITRFNTAKNTIDYKEESTGRVFRAVFNRPLVTHRDTILKLSEEGQSGMTELYRLITENSQIEELEPNEEAK